MGHASSRAALIYQHATAERDRAIADALSKVAARGTGTEARATTTTRLATVRLLTDVVRMWHAGLVVEAEMTKGQVCGSVPDLAVLRVERVTGIEPALSAWE